LTRGCKGGRCRLGLDVGAHNLMPPRCPGRLFIKDYARLLQSDLNAVCIISGRIREVRCGGSELHILGLTRCPNLPPPSEDLKTRLAMALVAPLAPIRLKIGMNGPILQNQ
jgi:hypothetical protein